MTYVVNEKPTNVLIIQCIGTQYSPTRFGTLKCHHQGVKHDPPEIGCQCSGKQRRIEAVFVTGDVRVGTIPCYKFPFFSASHDIGHLSQKIMFDSLMMAF
jgi:hypothetical protein